MSDLSAARKLAEGAGQLLLDLRLQGLDPAALREQGDAQSHAWLMEQLSLLFPSDSVLSEEGEHVSDRLDADRVWIVDPLDGTREYSEDGRTDWAVHVALWERGELACGAVALPARDATYGSEEAALPAAPVSGPIRLAVSRTRPPAFVSALAERLGATLVPMGSAGVKTIAVVTGEADAYVHAGGQYEWDSAAPVAVARAAGLHTSRIDGSALVYNRPDPMLPDLLVCRPEIAEHLLTEIARLAGEEETQ